MIKENELQKRYIDLFHDIDVFIKELNLQILELNPEKMDIKQWQRKHDSLVKKQDRWIKIKKVLSPAILDVIDYKSLEVHHERDSK